MNNLKLFIGIIKKNVIFCYENVVLRTIIIIGIAILILLIISLSLFNSIQKTITDTDIVNLYNSYIENTDGSDNKEFSNWFYENSDVTVNFQIEEINKHNIIYHNSSYSELQINVKTSNVNIDPVITISGDSVSKLRNSLIETITKKDNSDPKKYLNWSRGKIATTNIVNNAIKGYFNEQVNLKNKWYYHYYTKDNNADKVQIIFTTSEINSEKDSKNYNYWKCTITVNPAADTPADFTPNIQPDWYKNMKFILSLNWLIVENIKIQSGQIPSILFHNDIYNY